MSTLLAQVNAKAGAAEGEEKLDVRFEVGRTLALMILGCVILAGAVILWLEEKDTGAMAMFGLGEAIVVGGFGIALGEKQGAEEAAKKLGSG